MSAWSEFGQKVDLTGRIREVLQNYPEGTSVIKEILQNADDAGAWTVKLCLDLRQHPTGSLVHKGLAGFCGPALLAYNDAEFTEADLESISHVGLSVKRSQLGKTGRFGIGFNSCYHLGDLPSFVTGSKLIYFDPHCSNLPVSSANPGLMTSLGSDLLSTCPDQCQAFQAFGCTMDKPFPATLFRFPLRTAAQAECSRLSKQIYTAEKMLNLLGNFEQEAVAVMLFLKHVERIEVLQWSKGAAEPELLFACAVKDPDARMRSARAMFIRASQKDAQPSESFYTVDFATDGKRGSGSQRFLVGQALGGGEVSKRAAEASNAFGVPVTPFAGVAAPLSSTGAPEGLAYCFLPLPVRTGLPCHINGYFELSSNRRDIWTGDDLQGVGLMRAEWNIHLLKEVTGPLYARLLAEAATLLGAGLDYFKLWPTQQTASPWNILVESVYTAVADLPVLYTFAGADRWLTPSEAVLVTSADLRDTSLMEAVEAIGIPAVKLPDLVLRKLLDHTLSSPELLRPPYVRSMVLHNPAAVKAACRKGRMRLAAALLSYCMADIDDAEPLDLVGLPLVPKLDGEVWALGHHSQSGANLCVGTRIECQLFAPTCKDLLLDNEICGTDTANRLATIAARDQLNLCKITPTSVLVTFFPRSLPENWNGAEEVAWDPAAPGQPSTDWMQLLWVYFQSFKSLEWMRDWPVLPVAGGRLLQLRELRLSTAIRQSSEWPQQLMSALEGLKCRIVEESSWVSHPQLLKHVHVGNGTGVLKAIIAAHAEKKEWTASKITPQQRRSLRAYLLQERWLSEMQWSPPGQLAAAVRVLSSLPIFEVAARPETVSAATPAEFACFVSLTDVKLHLAPNSVHARTLTSTCIAPGNYREQEVMKRHLGVQQWGLAQHYRDMLQRLDTLDAEVRDKAIGDMLNQLPMLLHEDPEYKSFLSAVPFVPVASGALKAPQELFDPSVVELHGLLDASTSFPAGRFGSDLSLLSALRQLGLQSGIGPASILQAADLVSKLSLTNARGAHAKGKQLLELLDVEASRLFSARTRRSYLRQAPQEGAAKFWSEMRNIQWCPVLESAPLPSLPWPEVAQSVAMPSAMRKRADIWLVSSCMAILDGECRSAALEAGLGWSAPPPASVIATQLAALGSKNANCADRETSQALASAVPSIYTALSGLSSHDMDIATYTLQGARCIWVGTGFVSCKEVAFSGPASLAPRLFLVPAELQPFKDLFARLGVPDHFTAEQFASVLADIARAAGIAVLSAKELEQAIAIAQALSDLAVRGTQDLWVPNHKGVLHQAGELVYNDAPWLEAAGLNLVHPKLSYEVCSRVGVSVLRQQLLEESSTVMEMSEAFEQSESLTTRLKHITDAYVYGPGVISELIQNADDAGSKEVAFMLDNYTYPANKLLGEKLAAWQGPAIYCWNDQTFSHSDFHSLSKIGQDSKLDNIRATGRFGLGFNSVYHFTDLPELVSGNDLVLLDPHCAYLPGARKGARIAFLKMHLAEAFPDFTAPFLHFGCSLKERYDGTLFRFPLRTEETARKSEIKQIAYSPADILKLFKAFRPEVAKTLIFLKSVKKISIYTRAASADAAPELLFQSCLETEEGTTGPQDAICKFLGPTGDTRIGKEAFYKRLASTADKDLPSNCLPVTVRTFEAGVGTTEEQWLVLNALGGGEAKRLACQAKSNGRGYVPWTGVAAQIGIQKPDAALEAVPSLTGQAFAFLPLPVQTGLPLHVNGTFELSSNRRDLWHGKSSGDGEARAKWNLALLEDAAAPAYANLLEMAAQRMGPCKEFFSLWPVTPVPVPWASLRMAVFTALASKPVFWTKADHGKWLTLADARLPDKACLESADLAACLAAGGYPLVNAPPDLLEIVKKLCPGAKTATQPRIRTALRQPDAFKTVLNERKFEDRRQACELLLEYCLSDLNLSKSEDAIKLINIPLLVLADGTFQSLKLTHEAAAIYVMSRQEAEIFKSQSHRILTWHRDTVLGEKLAQLAETGAVNLKRMSAKELAENFLPAILPSTWKHQEEVAWTGGEGQPKMAWLQGLLGIIGPFSSLDALEAWPLLPVKGDCLRTLRMASLVCEQGSWAAPVDTALNKLGFAFVDATYLPPLLGQVQAYIHTATGPGILKAVHVMKEGNFEKVAELADEVGLNALERTQLRAFLAQARWFDEGGMSGLHSTTLRSLSIFEAAAAFGKESPAFVSLLEQKSMAPANVDPLLLKGSGLIIAGSHHEASVMDDKLGVLQLTRFELMQQHVLPRVHEIDPKARDDALLAFLRQPDARNQPLWAELPAVPFVPTEGVGLSRASDLYDPRNQQLQDLMDPDTSFPSKRFASDQQVLQNLCALGLQMDVTEKPLMEAAESLAGLKPSDPRARRRSATLLAELNKAALKEEGTQEGGTDWDKLRKLNWCAASRQRPGRGLPLFNLDDRFYLPEDMRPQEDAQSVSGVCGLVDGEASQALKERLGWARPPPVDNLKKQIRLLATREVTDPRRAEVVTKAMQQIFKELYRHFENGSPEEIQALKRLQDTNCIWTAKNTFCPPTSALLSSDQDLAPAVHAIAPPLAQAYKPLLLLLGVEPELGAAHCARGLVCLANLSRTSPLSDQHMELCKVLARHLARAKEQGQSIPTQFSLPDVERVMCPVPMLYYNEAVGWLDTDQAPDSMHPIHPDITEEQAKSLGVQSLRIIYQMTSNIGMEYRPCPGPQSLSRALEELPKDVAAVLYSIAELADAAGAERFEISLDEREHPSQSLLQHEFSQFQGPALCFNIPGAVMTAEQISRLQLVLVPFVFQEQDCSYGSGLTLTYRIGDVQQILSGDSLFVSDPRCCLYRGSQQEGAARQYRVAGTELADKFPDQFACWDFAGKLNLADNIKSTLIRLHLRTPAQAEGNSLCEVVHEPAGIESMLNRQLQRLGQSLLFLRSLRHIIISRIPKDEAHLPKTLGQVSLVPNQRGELLRLPWERGRWERPSSRGFGNMLRPQRPELQKRLHMTLITVPGEGEAQEQHWVVHANVGMGRTHAMAMDRHNISYQLNPTAAIAYCTSADKDWGPQTNILPASGLFGPFPLVDQSFTEDCCKSMRFLIYANFALMGQRQQLYPQNADTNSVLDLYNKELLMAGVYGAWKNALMDATSNIQSASVYNLIPDQPDMHDGSDTETHVASQLFTKMMEEAAAGPYWLVWRNEQVQALHLQDGVFVKGDLSQFGDSAAAYIKRCLPLFDAPWRAKVALEAAHIEGCRALTPPVLRALLKDKMRAPSYHRAPITAQEAAELLVSCFTDLWEPVPEPGSALIDAGNARHTQPATLGGGFLAGLAGAVDRPALAQVIANVRRQAENPNFQGMLASLQSAFAGADPRAATASTSATAEPAGARQLVLSNVNDCLGLPVPDATGTVLPLGQRRLLFWSPMMTAMACDTFEMERASFLHPAANAALATCLQAADDLVLHLKLQELTLKECDRLLGSILPSAYKAQGPSIILWTGARGGLQAEHMLELWAVLQQLEAVHLESNWDDVQSWRLVPLRNKQLIRIGDRSMVFVPPPGAMAAADAQQNYRDLAHLTPIHFDHPPSTAADAAASQPPLAASSQASVFSHDSPGPSSHAVRISESGSTSVEQQQQQNDAEHVQATAPDVRSGRDFGVWNWLLPLIERLRLPVLDGRFACLSTLCVDPAAAEQDQVLKKLTQAGQIGSINASLLLEEEKVHMFEYFTAEAPSSEALGSAEEAFLRYMPIFPDWTGKRVDCSSLIGSCTHDLMQMVACSPSELPPALQARLLNPGVGLPISDALAKRLGVQILNDVDLLVKIMLPNFTILSPAASKRALEWTVLHWSTMKDNEELCRALAETTFVTAGDGAMYKPKEMLDPSNDLLQRVFKNANVFPAEQFAAPRWLTVLKATGLKSTIDQEAFVAIARQIEGAWVTASYGATSNEGGDVSSEQEEIWQTALEAAKHFREHATSLHGADLYSQLRSVTFVPATKGLPGSRSAQHVLTNYASAAIERDSHLAWTVSNIIPTNALPSPHAWTPLGLKSPPVFATIAEHLCKLGGDAGEECLNKWPIAGPSLESVFSKILAHLGDEGLNERQRESLKDARFVPVANATQLVAPSRLFARLREDLAPFAYEVPPIFAEHLPILKLMGCRDSPKSSDLLQILEGLQEVGGGTCLNVNELGTVINLLRAVAKDPKVQPSLDKLRRQGQLLVPGLNSRLLPAHNCIHAFTASRALLQRIDPESIHFVHPQMTLELCNLLAIPPLEVATRETLDSSRDLVQLPEIQGKSCKKVQDLLSSADIAKAVHGMILQFGSVVPAFKKLQQRDIAVTLRDVARRLRFVEACHTRIILLSGEVDVTSSWEGSQVPEFEDKDSGQVYVALPPSGVPLEAVLSRMLSRQLGSPVPLPLDALLACPSQDLKSLQEAFFLQGQMAGAFDLAESAGKLGAPLTPQDAALIMLRPTRPFAADELCAMWSQRPAAEAAATAAELRAAGQTLPGSSGNELVYVRVVEDARPQPGKPLFVVVVEKAPGQLSSVTSNQLLSFRNGNTAEAERVRRAQFAPTTPGVTQPSPNADSLNPTAPTEDAVASAVGPKEIASAVREMLVAAGMPVDLERTTLLERTLRLQDDLERANARLLSTEKDAIRAKEEFEEVSDKWMCKICSTIEIQCVLSCGHAMCLDCSATLGGQQSQRDCPFCRKPVSVQRIFNA